MVGDTFCYHGIDPIRDVRSSKLSPSRHLLDRYRENYKGMSYDECSIKCESIWDILIKNVDTIFLQFWRDCFMMNALKFLTIKWARNVKVFQTILSKCSSNKCQSLNFTVFLTWCLIKTNLLIKKNLSYHIAAKTFWHIEEGHLINIDLSRKKISGS